MQPLYPPPLPPAGWPPPPAARPEGPRETKAAASLALGVMSVVGAMCGVGLSLGIPAIILGALAHRDIRRSGGMAGGGGLATAGIFLGAMGSILFVVWVGIVAFAVLGSSPPTASLFPRSQESPPATAPARPARPVVELHAGGGSLRTQLVGQVVAAHRAGQAVLVETSMKSCDPCAEIDQVAPDPAVQQAMADVRWIRIDVSEFRSELAGLRMNEPTVPWFYLLDSRGQPRDAISADEWDDNVAENIGPVLGAFVHGKLQPRRTSWRGRTLL
jgi:thiol:disulfide interchange protein